MSPQEDRVRLATDENEWLDDQFISLHCTYL